MIYKIEYKLSNFFETGKDFQLKRIFKIAILIALANLIYALCLINLVPLPSGTSKNVAPITFTFRNVLLITLIGPLLEEIVFRLPLYFIHKIFDSYIITLVTLLGSSIVFGYLHGNYFNIFIQGVGGLIYGVVFLRNSIEDDSPKTGLLSSTICHGTFNCLCYICCFFMK